MPPPIVWNAASGKYTTHAAAIPRAVPSSSVALADAGAPESGVQWPIITAATLMSVAPLLVAFVLFQRQFVQSFMRAGIR